jgi:hypothetical protein
MKISFMVALILTVVMNVDAQASVCDGRTTELSLVLAIDVSGSIDNQEVRTQLEGYHAALSHPGLVNNLLNCQCTAIGVVLWATHAQVAFPLQRMESSRDIEHLKSFFADLIGTNQLAYTRGLSTTTELVNALKVSRDYVLEYQDSSESLMIMISGDGYDSRMYATLEALRQLRRDNEASKIVVHGIPLDIYRELNDFADPSERDKNPALMAPIQQNPYENVSDYYRQEVITRDGLVEVAESFAEFERALTRTLLRNTCNLMM